ncbi:hypothetical protein E2C01_051345 [Portunus trituberculatus]|uniref:Uncharacterized protein n=1 Tax=Portunus trituberculatus TaxID=210409 RepID=A0A5B7GIF8_PORTR|nr:hypothetical protein [Portunus trituberculatus]
MTADAAAISEATLHNDVLQVYSDVFEEGQVSEPSSVEEVFIMENYVLTEENGNLMLQHAYTGPANLAEVDQVAILFVDLVHQNLELAVMKALGEDGVDDLHHNRLDVKNNKLLVVDVVHLVDGLFWYLSFVACVWNSSTCTWQRSNHNASLQYQLTLVNGDPGAADHNPFEYQFSFDKQVRENYF